MTAEEEKLVEAIKDEIPENEENGDEEDGNEKEATAGAGNGAAEGVKKKKRKKKKKKKKGTGATTYPNAGVPSKKTHGLRLIPEDSFTDSYIAYGQTEPPTIPIATLFKGREFPKGEIQSYQDEDIDLGSLLGNQFQIVLRNVSIELLTKA